MHNQSAVDRAVYVKDPRDEEFEAKLKAITTSISRSLNGLTEMVGLHLHIGKIERDRAAEGAGKHLTEQPRLL